MKIIVIDILFMIAAALFAPLVLGLFLALMLILLPIGLVFLFNPFKGPLYGTRLQAAWEISEAVVVVVAITAPLRALTVGIYGDAPGLLRAFSFWTSPVIELWGPQVIAQMDWWWAVLSGTAIALFTVLDGGWRLLQARQIKILPTSRARSVAVGLAQLAGRAKPIASKNATAPILRSGWDVEGEHAISVKELQPFWLEDDTGRLLVDPRGAEFVDRARWKGTNLGGFLHGFSLRSYEVMLTRRHEKSRQGIFQVLRPGDPIYVIGNVRPRATYPATDIPNDAELVVAPRKGQLGFRFHDVFLLSDASEKTTERMMRSGVIAGLGWSALGLALCAWLYTIAAAGHSNPVTAYGYAPVPLDVETSARREIPLMSRSIDILDSETSIWRRTRSVQWMLDALRARPLSETRRYLPYLHALGAREPAMELLQELSRSDDPDQATIAKRSLTSWPDGGPDWKW